jgi:hypothetical protein
MYFVDRVWRSNFFIKLRHWEFWPFGILQFPIIFYYLWLSARARSFFFFSASNPGIDMGGLLGESKFDILKKIPEAYTAKTILIKQNTSLPTILQKMKEANLSFPLIFKPDLGERGFLVKRIYTETQAAKYAQSFRFDFLIQELIDLPYEFGVFYKCLPSENSGRVFSITGKKMLTVTGDGISTLQTLIMQQDRAKLQWQKLKLAYADQLNDVIPPGIEVILNSIGNHCLGTMFINSNALIDDELNASFDRISKQIDGFYYGRFDLRCGSIEDLKKGKIKIVELNGCGAEPAHIYHPGYSFWKAVSEMIDHWRNIFEIAIENKKRGVSFLSFAEVKIFYRKFKEATTE